MSFHFHKFSEISYESKKAEVKMYAGNIQFLCYHLFFLLSSLQLLWFRSQQRALHKTLYLTPVTSIKTKVFLNLQHASM